GTNQSLFYFQNEGAGLTIDREGNIRYAWGRGRGGMARLSIKPDEWTFVALTVEPKMAVVTVHQPGSEAQRKEFKKGTHKPLELTRFYVGGTSSKNCLEGAADDVRIYNYPLSEKDLRQLAERK
ncbi:MAG: LamG domain-containing protein, partial [Kiritimatiellales bacterium]|nr:LamG domain-containing protein [Kiritimatiellales bacterium]